MLETWNLLWRHLAAQPLSVYWGLQPWHLNLVLLTLGLLAAGGLHHLLGFTFRLYRVHTVHRSWLGLPSLLVLLAAVQLLVGAYVVGTQAQALARASLSRAEGSLPAQRSPAAGLGAALLDPALSGPLGQAQFISKDELVSALSGLTEGQYLEKLKTFVVAPAALDPQISNEQPAPPQATPTPPAPPRPPSSAGAQLGLRWLLEEEHALPPGAPPLESRLPGLTVALIAAVPPQLMPAAALSRSGWEQLVGEQFAALVLGPILARGISRAAMAVAALTLAASGAYFFALIRLRRTVHRGAAAKVEPPAADAAK